MYLYFGERSCEPYKLTTMLSVRCWPFVASSKDNIYLWGGKGDSEPETVCIYSVNTEKWMKEFTMGPHPPAQLEDGGCCLVGQHLYIYGGSVGGGSYSGSLYQLNTNSFTWNELSNCSTGGPVGKDGCRMIPYQDDLIVIGGYFGDHEPGLKQPGSRYEDRYTNEIHCYSLSAGAWSSPPVDGSRPPPCAYFSVTMIDEESAVMFGGHTSGWSADVYTLYLPTMSWIHLPHNDGDPRPEGRSSSAAVCLGYDSQHKSILVSGGWNLRRVFCDTWLLDPMSGIFEEVLVSDNRLLQRYGHGATPLAINPTCTEVVMVCGKQEQFQASNADTVVLRFELQDTRFSLTDIADQTLLGSSLRLDDKRRMMESFNSGMKMTAEKTDTKVEQLQKELQEQIRIASEQQREYEQRLQEYAREIELSRKQLRECKQHLQKRTDELRECEQRLSNQWVVRKEEIEITGTEIGRGGSATVREASFRGLRVAAKVIHHQIISHHNRQLFVREMRIAAMLRHPNLVQFIGAADEGDMVILTELMPTTLRAQLQQEVYLQPNLVIKISLDVARALNYLHQMKPDPITHRDISSVNVLLEPLPGGQWRAKLSDYGTVNVVRHLETVSPGSPVYAAPEANNPHLQSPKMDIYSYGALILEMLTGQLPAPEDRPALLLKVHHDQLLDLIQRCLSESEHDRPDAGTIIGVLIMLGNNENA